MTSTTNRGTAMPLVGYMTWLIILSAVAYVIGATNQVGYCNFPEYLWRPLPDGAERKWLNRAIYKGKSEALTKRKEIVVLRTKIVVSLVSREPCGETVNSTASLDICYRTQELLTYWCLAEEAADKFRVVVQRDKKDEFTCLKLQRRDTHVVQLWSARRNEVNEGSLCDEEALKRDPWPWITVLVSAASCIHCTAGLAATLPPNND
ncbi:hypothetical protein LSAT2_024412 [Lamellibrachia satsuma]|nr:hypothetical protein LSAT2_024412 [Lamellibrachia satsuma]